MRIPAWPAPLLLVVAAGLAAADVALTVATVNGGDAFVVPYESYSDEHITYTTIQVYWGEVGDEVRTIGPRHSNLAGDLGFAVVPGGHASDLINGTADILYASAGQGPQTFTIPDGHHWDNQTSSILNWDDHGSVSLVWFITDQNPDYDRLAPLLLQYKVEGREPESHYVMVANGDWMRAEPWVRGSAWTLATLAAASFFMRTRTRPAIFDPQDRPIGGASALAEAGERFLFSLRGANILLVALTAVIAGFFVATVSLFAGSLSNGEGTFLPRQQPFNGWQAEIFAQCVTLSVIALAVASAPAVRSFQALRRWRQMESNPPIEGELGD